MRSTARALLIVFWEAVAATLPVVFRANQAFKPQGINQAGITSTYRTPAHNKDVGGVANSYHTRRGANGEPLAVDSVPPKGMGMGQYAAHLRRLNPNLDVINEGDHVHVEPRGR